MDLCGSANIVSGFGNLGIECRERLGFGFWPIEYGLGWCLAERKGLDLLGIFFDWDGSVWQVGDRVFKMSWGVWIEFGWFLEN